VVWYHRRPHRGARPNGKVYGRGGSPRFSRRTRAPNAEQIRDAILADVATYTDAHTQQDEITLIVLDFSSMGTRLEVPAGVLLAAALGAARLRRGAVPLQR